MKLNRSGQAEALTKQQFLEVLSKLPDPHRVIFALTWYCAERAGAVCKLKVSDCYQAGKPRAKILIPGRIRKDRNSREVPVSRGLAQILKTYPLPKSEWLFPSYFNPSRPICLQVFAAAIKRQYLNLGLYGFSTHSARRGAITYLSRSGLGARQIQAVTGHRSLNSVQSYIDVSPAEIEAGLALL